MSDIWFQSTDDTSQWCAFALATEVNDLSTIVGVPVFAVQFTTAGQQSQAALIVGADATVSVNGRVVVGGLKVLAHRDEILVKRRLLYYSDETLPVVSVYRLTDGQRSPRCAVCRMSILDGQTVVTCPRCSRVLHQSATVDDEQSKKCWTYRPHCLCGHPTSLDGDTAWRPSQEEIHG